jgi:hypothetical protein
MQKSTDFGDDYWHVRLGGEVVTRVDEGTPL